MEVKRVGCLIVDHGSRRTEANEMLEDVVQSLWKESGGRFCHIAWAHMELAEPSIELGFRACVEAGATEIIVSLFFLSPGRHSLSDIPAMVRDVAKAFPNIRVCIARPLGVDVLLTRLLLQRMDEAS